MRRTISWFLIGASAPLIAALVAVFWFSPLERCIREQQRSLKVDGATAHRLCAVLKH